MKQMKVTVIALAICATLFSCNSGDSSKEGAKDTAATATPAQPAVDANQKGLEMIAADNCTTCHKIEEKNIGPAYRDVANKYENTPANIDSLALKVIHGGQGVWGTTPMTPHPGLGMDSAREMVKYILSLRTQK
jgi:cytochrome c